MGAAVVHAPGGRYKLYDATTATSEVHPNLLTKRLSTAVPRWLCTGTDRYSSMQGERVVIARWPGRPPAPSVLLVVWTELCRALGRIALCVGAAQEVMDWRQILSRAKREASTGHVAGNSLSLKYL